MLEALTFAAVIVAVFLLILAIRTFGRERPALWLLIPTLVAFALGSGHVVNAMMGYATSELSDLEKPFFYVSHSGAEPVFLLAVPSGSNRPRLYELPELTMEERQALHNAKMKAANGVAQMGNFSEGEMQIYDFRVDQIAPKQG